ncbi:hypothetical protein [Methylobacterium iners]|uniref:Uncharacterized protein n=1 Tax=Methylobacterium iners TaxID=418707 RepID=A0ABQ4S4A3_9HYPH|nr:hypothetical protein [Methylobacterium iners]GJD96633.1 hypothetical protein OCOJLMKI_3856 [Methylobacterium iners]
MTEMPRRLTRTLATAHTDGYVQALRDVRRWAQARISSEGSSSDAQSDLKAMILAIDNRMAAKQGAIWCDDTWDEPSSG